MKTTYFLTKSERSFLINEFVECQVDIYGDEYTEDQERYDREYLSRLDNQKFAEEMTAQMPDWVEWMAE